MNQQKVLGDTILATKDTIFVLQQWRNLLVRWQTLGEVEPEIFADICQQLKDAGLWQWARDAGGHGLEALMKLDGISAPALKQLQFGMGRDLYLFEEWFTTERGERNAR